MAKFNIFSKTLLFLAMVITISNTLVFAVQEHLGPDIIEEHIIPAAGVIDDYDYADAPVVYDLPLPESEPEDVKYVRECADQMTYECSKLVFFYMFEEGLNATKTCCGELVKMGEPCHIALVKSVFKMPEYSANATFGIPRSKQLWNKCALIVEPIPSAPVPFVN
ncbi:hypothetical protein ACOSP7_012635 [Xanthoceras sorbifolium]